MEGVVWAALVTSIGAAAVALFGFWVNRRAGVPDALGKAIRAELEASIEAATRKATRLEAELDEERAARMTASAACDERVSRLVDAIIERDLIISSLHVRLGLPPPHAIDPRG